MKVRLHGSIAITIASIFICGAAQATNYVATFLDGKYGTAYGINNAGQVVGTASYIDDSGDVRATIWNGTTPTDLSKFVPGRTSYSQALGINGSGKVAGTSSPSSTVDFRTTLWDGSTTTYFSGGQYSKASSINDAGQMVGWSSYGDKSHAYRWDTSGGLAIDLGPPGVNSEALGINSSGQVVGYVDTPDNQSFRATIWNGTTATDLGTHGIASRATGINNAGQVVGWTMKSNGAVHATLWSGTTVNDLGTLGGESSLAFGINNNGQVVGFSRIAGGATHAALWNGNNVTDLNLYLDADLVSAGWYLDLALGVNDAGSIVGRATNSKTGDSRAFILAISAVPEPQTYALMLAGIGLIAGVARRRGKQK
ncbi:PEP-CTERM sorting domain-containing protein [Roseateles albus]|uniref:PEP-CTERM sorting domain-containing protein n=1 Tax=Roseateles albus TaxID=2987525 RepID=A0ABT5KE65_9BURK|nr:PEP-CTERM sorting domain-containing protein [Roseateles albus]MDC8771734.1 PEP-CTERM sorting domain-containing protein [Roseateles albus]